MMLSLHSLATLSLSGFIFVTLSIAIDTKCALLELTHVDREFYKRLSGGCLLAAVAAWVFALFDIAVGAYMLLRDIAQ